jgi:hypothetical protein
MRKVATALFYLLMIGVGMWLCIGWFEEGGRKIGPLAGGTLVLFGGYLLWLDFLSAKRL